MAKKIWNAYVAFFVCAMVAILTSCEGSEIMEYFGTEPETKYVTQQVLVERDKLYPVLSNVLISDQTIFINNKSVATYSVEHLLPTIEMPANEHVAAGIVEFDGETLRDSNGQTTTMSVTITPSSDGSYTLDAKITPNEAQYSKITKLHKKVSLVTTYYILSGHVTVIVDGKTQSSDFSLPVTRHYLLVDPTVDIETVVLTDTIEKLVIHTDTIINTVEVEKLRVDTVTVEKTVTMHDTITVQVDRFIRGNDVHKSIINEFGSSIGTLLLGNKQLVNIELRLQKPVIDVNTFGTEIGQTSALEWRGTDGQWVIGTSAANGATVSGIDFQRVETNVLAEDNLVQIRLVFLAKGTYVNENGDSYDFEMELRPSYLQKIDKVVVVDHDKIVEIYNGVWFDGKNFTINGALAGTVDVAHKKQLIELPIASHKEAKITSANGLTWQDSNGQTTNGTCKVYGNAGLTMSLKPAADYSSITSIHPKVSLVTTHHDLTGQVSVGNTTESFSFVLDRSYLLSDPSVDIKVVERTDTIEKLIIQTDTIINTVEVEKIVNHTDTVFVEVEKKVTVTDTITVEVEKFVKGADVRTIVVNDFGTATGTLTLGDKQLLKITLDHEQPVIEVAENILGNVSFSNVGTLKWQGTDTQITNGTQSGNATVTSFKYDRVEYKTITAGALVLVRTFYTVKGSYTNENGDANNFEMELAPSYLQKYVAPAPEVIVPEVNLYRGIIRKVSVEDVKLMCKPIVQKWNKSTNAWEDVRTASRCCIGMSGKPSGLDLFVKDCKVIEETENSWWYSGNDATWNGDDTKSDGTVVTKRTKIYEFNHLFAADAVANGKVGPATQLYVMRAEKVQVLDPENNLLTCTWEDGSEFSLSISVLLNDTEFTEDAALVGKTRTESDKIYKYAKSFVQHFSASIGGNKLADTDAKSNLWIPAE